jgi:hypothetical protein
VTQRGPFRYSFTSPEVIRFAAMLYVGTVKAMRLEPGRGSATLSA